MIGREGKARALPSSASRRERVQGRALPGGMRSRGAAPPNWGFLRAFFALKSGVQGAEKPLDGKSSGKPAVFLILGL